MSILDILLPGLAFNAQADVHPTDGAGSQGGQTARGSLSLPHHFRGPPAALQVGPQSLLPDLTQPGQGGQNQDQDWAGPGV